MKQRLGKTLGFVIASIAVLFSIPNPIIDNFKSLSVYIVNPLPFRKITENRKDAEVQKLTVENQLLRKENDDLLALIDHYYSIQSYSDGVSEFQKLLKMHLKSKPARIIYRSANAWNHSFWIDKGHKKNKGVLSKGSIVVFGSSLIGVVDYVGKYQSRVRMITDPNLHPSVRVVRGNRKDLLLAEKISSLIPLILLKEGDEQERKALIENLNTFKKSLNLSKETHFLAKGELKGSSTFEWRKSIPLLEGTGFNYDFPDDKGPARDLRTGEPITDDKTIKTMPIIKEGDILVTTGLDGVFPPGLNVAKVTKVDLLKEGDYYYNILATPTVENIDNLTYVIVLPPVGFDKKDQPHAFE